MKYLVRSIKYYFYLLIILCLIIAVLIAAGFVESDISQIFVNGYRSLWQIALMLAVFALVYPRFGYSSRIVHIYGSYEEIRPTVVSVMEARGYCLEREDGEDLSFVRNSSFSRALKMWEDRISFSRVPSGFEIEGISKDIVRIAESFSSDGASE